MARKDETRTSLNSMTHTPVPWEVIGRSVYQIDKAGGREVIHGSGIKGRDSEERDRQDVIEEQEANARFIVTACNCHADLLEAAKNANSILERIVDSFPDNESPHPSIQECMDAFVATSEAIRKAEETQS